MPRVQVKCKEFWWCKPRQCVKGWWWQYVGCYAYGANYRCWFDFGEFSNTKRFQYFTESQNVDCQYWCIKCWNGTNKGTMTLIKDKFSLGTIVILGDVWRAGTCTMSQVATWDEKNESNNYWCNIQPGVQRQCI